MVTITSDDLDGISYSANDVTVEIAPSTLIYSTQDAVNSLYSQSTLINHGFIAGSGGNATFYSGVAFVGGSNGSITNTVEGSIRGAYGVFLLGNGHYSLANHGDIAGVQSGVLFAVSDCEIINSGTIFGRDGNGIQCGNGGTIENTGIIKAGINPINFGSSGGVLAINNGVGGVIETLDPVSFAAIYTGGTGAISLDNRGTINAIINCDASNAADVVMNRGEIFGDVFLGSGDDTFNGLTGTSGAVFGEAGNDTLIGSTHDDWLDGGADNDTLRGGLGKDNLIGDTGADIFDFDSIKESVRGAKRDQILDFNSGEADKIDLKGIDAKTGVGGNQAFKFIGKHGFHDVKGELRYIDKGSTCIVQGDVNGDGKADFEIFVNVDSLAKGDFVL